jgi:hypothetical protein
MSQDLISWNTTHENADFGHSKSNMEIENLKNKDLNVLDGLFRQFWGE